MTTIGRPGPLDPSAPSGPLDLVAAPATGTGAPLRTPDLAANATLVAVARGEQTIGMNARGEAPRLVQAKLIALGFSVGRSGADGWWGRNSMAGLSEFQRRAGLPPTGIVDAATLAALDRALSPAPEDAKAAVERTLAQAAADGLLGAAELQAAEADIAARYGPDVARKVLLENFGVHADKLDAAAVGFLQGRTGSLQGHIARYQELLSEHLAGAKIVDVNADGKLDSGDLVFTPAAAGRVSVQRVTDALRDELKIAKAMVDACHAMGAARHSFELIKNHRANPAFFDVDKESGVFTLKAGKRAADAVRDIFQNPSQYGFECATAMVIVYYKAMLDLLGDNDFNRICGDLRIGPWAWENDLAAANRIAGSSSTEAPGGMPAAGTLRAGEYRYIKNWDVSEDGRKAGWQGENVIYLGGGKYFGHPFGVASAETIVSYLNTHRKSGATRSASMNTLSGFLDRSVRRHDLDPNG